METSKNLLSNDLQVDSRIALHLKETAGWARFLGILGFVMAGIIAIIAFIVPTIYSRSYYRYDPYGSGSYSSSNTGMIVGMTIVYLLIAAIMFFVALFTYNFGNKTKNALALTDQNSLDKGMMNLKFLFRFYGIVAIIYLGILVLALLAGGLTASFR